MSAVYCPFTSATRHSGSLAAEPMCRSDALAIKNCERTSLATEMLRLLGGGQATNACAVRHHNGGAKTNKIYCKNGLRWRAKYECIEKKKDQGTDCLVTGGVGGHYSGTCSSLVLFLFYKVTAVIIILVPGDKIAIIDGITTNGYRFVPTETFFCQNCAVDNYGVSV